MYHLLTHLTTYSLTVLTNAPAVGVGECAAAVHLVGQPLAHVLGNAVALAAPALVGLFKVKYERNKGCECVSY